MEIQPTIIDNLSECVPGTFISKYCLWNIFHKCKNISDNVDALPYQTSIGNVSIMIFKHGRGRRCMIKYINNTFICDL